MNPEPIRAFCTNLADGPTGLDAVGVGMLIALGAILVGAAVSALLWKELNR